MEVLSSRLLIRPRDPKVTAAFYRDVLGLAVYREFPGGTVFFLGQGLLEVSGSSHAAPPAVPASEPTLVPTPTNPTPTNPTPTNPSPAQLWMQVRDLRATAADLVLRGVAVLREPRREPWGLDEMWITDPDGLRIVLVEIPEGHPIRTDTRRPTGR
jgi:catechol 2,3-dioxygenase-like lactoylglutathione lyase family enzyme